MTRALLAAIVAVAAMLSLAPSAGAADITRPATLTSPPKNFRLSANQATKIASRADRLPAARKKYGKLTPVQYMRGPGRWQISWFAKGKERVQVIVDDRLGAISEEWGPPQIAWQMARGYEGAFGRKANAPYVWLPLCFLFFAAFFDPRRPFRMLHLDLLVLLGFGVSHIFFNRGEISTSVPLAYPVLAYLLARLLWVAMRPRSRPGPLVPVVPIVALGLAVIFLTGFRLALNVTDSNVIDVGYSGVIGADRIMDGESLYEGDFHKTNKHGDTYGPVNYLAYVPWEQGLTWSGKWDDLPAAHGAAIMFDLLTLLGLFVLGRRLRAGPDGTALGVALAFAWVSFPYSLYALESNSNDSLVPALLVWALVFIASPPARGALAALAGFSKWVPLAVAPLLLLGRERSAKGTLMAAATFVAASAIVLLPWMPDGGPAEIYDRTLGYQASRESPFAIWGQADWLAPVHTGVKVGAVALALLVCAYPRRRDTAQIAALAGAVLIAFQLATTHWFYLYIVWFAPLAFVAFFAREQVVGKLPPLRDPAPVEPSARWQEDLLDRDGAPVVVRLDQHGVQPGIG